MQGQCILSAALQSDQRLEMVNLIMSCRVNPFCLLGDNCLAPAALQFVVRQELVRLATMLCRVRPFSLLGEHCINPAALQLGLKQELVNLTCNAGLVHFVC